MTEIDRGIGDQFQESNMMDNGTFLANPDWRVKKKGKTKKQHTKPSVNTKTAQKPAKFDFTGYFGTNPDYTSEMDM